MSSPFRYFRKHTKAFMAVAAVMCMFIFVIGGAINSGGSSRDDRRDAAAPVATWDGGALNQGELANLVAQRRIVDEFLRRLFAQGGGRSEYDLPTSVPNLLLPTQRADQIEDVVIATEINASLARQAGLSVSDAMVNYYVEEFGSKNVDKNAVVGILGSIGQGGARANEGIVFDMLRKMLLAHFYRRAYADASQVLLPQERWENWRLVNERISLQVAMLPVESFVSKAPDPTEAQQRELYEEFKNDEPTFYDAGHRELASPDPAFAEPRRVRLQYVLGSVQERAKNWLDKVTDEEIADYYERNKRLEFIKLDLPDEDEPEGEGAESAPATEEPASPETTPPATPESSATAPEGEPAVEAPAESAPADSAPADSETEADGSEPAAPEAESAEPPAAEDAAPAEEEATPPPTADGEETSSIRESSPFRLAAFQTPPAETAETPVSDENAEQPVGAEDPADNAAETEPASKPAEEDAAETDAATTDAAAEPATGADPAVASEEEEKIEYEPLEKVRDEIRETLATEKAADEIERLMSRANLQLQSEYNQYGAALVEATARKKKTPAPPEKLTDLKWLADQYGLIAEKLDPLTGRQLIETAVGKAPQASTSTGSVTGAAFTTLKLYEPFLAKESSDGQWYLVIKTEDTPKRVPAFKQIRNKVIAAWKHREAAKLAEKKAQELAKEAEKASTPFTEFFAGEGYEVVKRTSFFSYLDYPAGSIGTGTPPGLGDVPELSSIDSNFLRAAFALEGNKTVGLLNFDHSMAYVIRLAQRQYTEDELRTFFLEDSNSWPGLRDSVMRHYSRFNAAVLKDLEERSGLEYDKKWLAQQRERAQRRD